MITIRADGATFEHGAMILPPKYLEYGVFSSVFGLCNFSGKNRPCIYMFAMDKNGFQIACVLSKEVLDHTKYEFYLPQMELSTVRLIFVK